MKTSKSSSAKAAKEKKQLLEDYEKTLIILKKMEKIVRLTIKEVLDEGLNPKAKLNLTRKIDSLHEEITRELETCALSLKKYDLKKQKSKK